MPVTPFHFGPGAAIHALVPRHISFLAFCAANVIIDCETLYHLLTHQYPLHTFFHTCIGATAVAAGTVALFAVGRRLAARGRLPNVGNWMALGFPAVILGAALGTYSHIVLDSLMHEDIRPLAPFSDANPLLHAVSVGTLHGSCVAAGVVGVCLLGVRRLLRKEKLG